MISLTLSTRLPVIKKINCLINTLSPVCAVQAAEE